MMQRCLTIVLSRREPLSTHYEEKKRGGGWRERRKEKRKGKEREGKRKKERKDKGDWTELGQALLCLTTEVDKTVQKKSDGIHKSAIMHVATRDLKASMHNTTLLSCVYCL